MQIEERPAKWLDAPLKPCMSGSGYVLSPRDARYAVAAFVCTHHRTA